MNMCASTLLVAKIFLFQDLSEVKLKTIPVSTENLQFIPPQFIHCVTPPYRGRRPAASQMRLPSAGAYFSAHERLFDIF